MNLYNLVRDALRPTYATISPSVDQPRVDINFVALSCYATLSVLLYYLQRVKQPYLSMLFHILFCLLQVCMVIWLIFSANFYVSLFAQCMLVVCALGCFLERTILSIKLRSMAPFMSMADNFAIIKTTCNNYVFPVERSSDNLVVLTTSRGIYSNGVFMKGAITVSDNALVVSLFKSHSLLLDRVEHGYDYTVFIYINSVILQNIKPTVSVVNTEFTDVEL
nr:NS3 protein [Rousettus bat coronavirus]